MSEFQWGRQEGLGHVWSWVAEGEERKRRGVADDDLALGQRQCPSSVQTSRPTIIPTTGNERKVVDRGQDKGAMIRTSGGDRRAGGGRRWQWRQGRK